MIHFILLVSSVSVSQCLYQKMTASDGVNNINLKILYKENIDTIKRYSASNNIPNTKLHQVFLSCFHLLKVKTNKCNTIPRKKNKFISALFVICLVIFIFYEYPTGHTILLHNSQNFIYPGLKVLRKIAVPVITRYSSLSEYYDEWCLLENPFFQIRDMDCWPCRTVYSVPNFTSLNVNKHFNIGIPYTKVDTAARKVTVKDIGELYYKHADVFDQGNTRVTTNNSTFRTIKDVVEQAMNLHPSLYRENHITWRIVKTQPGRLLRKLFFSAKNTPNWWSPSTEKFVFIDEPNSPAYTLPNPECNNILMVCTNGGRLIHMIPSTECFQNCKETRILLPAKYTLYYNWWYWRPVTVPVSNVTEITINYLASYC